MLSPYYSELLKKLRKSLEAYDLTPVDVIGAGTYVCLTEAIQSGIVYHQAAFDSLPRDWRQALDGKQKGYKFGNIKVIAVFDIWPEENSKQTPPVEVFDN